MKKPRGNKNKEIVRLARELVMAERRAEAADSALRRAVKHVSPVYLVTCEEEMPPASWFRSYRGIVPEYHWRVSSAYRGSPWYPMMNAARLFLDTQWAQRRALLDQLVEVFRPSADDASKLTAYLCEDAVGLKP